jgi:hypothetical protein
MEIREEDCGWRLRFRDGVVQLIQVDFRLTLFLGDGADTAKLVVETPFRLIALENDVVCSPEKPASLAPILPLVNARITGVLAQKSGWLRVEFDSGRSLEVAPNESYEAWQLGSSIGFLLVCSPGGGVSFFKEDRKGMSTGQKASNAGSK